MNPILTSIKGQLSGRYLDYGKSWFTISAQECSCHPEPKMHSFKMEDFPIDTEWVDKNIGKIVTLTLYLELE